MAEATVYAIWSKDVKTPILGGNSYFERNEAKFGPPVAAQYIDTTLDYLVQVDLTGRGRLTPSEIVELAHLAFRGEVTEGVMKVTFASLRRPINRFADPEGSDGMRGGMFGPYGPL